MAMSASTAAGDTSRHSHQRHVLSDPLMQRRLDVLELAQTLGNVREACWRCRVSRTQFYVYRRRFQEQGVEGLKDRPPIHKTHPQTTPPAVVESVLALSFEHPGWGCHRLAAALKASGLEVSGVTVQGILARHGLGTHGERTLRLEERALTSRSSSAACASSGPIPAALLERVNPCYREHPTASRRPGDVLCQDTLVVRELRGISPACLYVIVDTFGSYAFGMLSPGDAPDASVATAVLHDRALSFYRERAIPVHALLTDYGREFWGWSGAGDRWDPYGDCLARNGIAHAHIGAASGRRSRVNGFLLRFRRTIRAEFLAPALRQRTLPTLQRMRADLDAWLTHYNTERPHRGYPNWGKRPMEMINDYVKAPRGDSGPYQLVLPW